VHRRAFSLVSFIVAIPALASRHHIRAESSLGGLPKT
jgi:hypothetical protein